MNVTIYSDGSSRGNPGPGGYGTVLLYVDKNGVTHRRELSQDTLIPRTTAWKLWALLLVWKH